MKVNLNDSERIKAPFEVPQDYFNQMEVDIQKKVASPAPAPNRQWVWATVPAFILILISGIWVVNQQVNTRSVSDLVADIPEEEIMAYLAFSDLSEQEIMSMSDESLLDDLGNLESIEIEDEELDGLLDSFEIDLMDLKDI
ncbi:MAG: hypothetical protein RJQ14_05690 [Marinoscillum sp.]